MFLEVSFPNEDDLTVETSRNTKKKNSTTAFLNAPESRKVDQTKDDTIYGRLHVRLPMCGHLRTLARGITLVT